jgi:hypothetical protein
VTAVRVFRLGLTPEEYERREHTLEALAATRYSEGRIGILAEVHAPEVGFESDRDDARGGRESE